MNKIIEEDVLFIINNNEIDKLKDKTVLITGASGMIGTYFVNTLIKLNETTNTNVKILALVRNKNKFPQYILENQNLLDL